MGSDIQGDETDVAESANLNWRHSPNNATFFNSVSTLSAFSPSPISLSSIPIFLRFVSLLSPPFPFFFCFLFFSFFFLGFLFLQLRRLLDLSTLSHSALISHSDFLLASSQRLAFAFQLHFENTVRELDDFKAWFDILSHRCPDQQDVAPDWLYEIIRAKGGTVTSAGAASEQHCKMLENEVATLKREYDKLSLKNSAEVTSLRAEIKFAWNQYNEKESTLSSRLQAKNDEVNKANETIMTLVDRLEQLELSNSEKDQTVSTLRASINRLEDEARQKDEMIASCSKELKLLKSNRPIGIPTLKRCSAEPSPSTSKRRSSSRNEKTRDLVEGQASAHLETAAATLKDKLYKLEVEANLKNEEIARLSKEINLLRSKTSGSTPVLGQCSSEPSSRLRSQVNGSSKSSAALKEEASQLISEKGGKRTKTKQEDVISMDDTPRLFTSQFKIPKLKSQSPRKRWYPLRHCAQYFW